MPDEPVTFAKYHGTGNDFAVFDVSAGLPWTFEQLVKLAPALCDRNRGIAADGILLVEPDVDGADGRMVVVNADGSRPEMCGNGVRVVARHLYEDFGKTDQLTVASDAGIKRCVVFPGPPFEVDVDMGEVRYVGEIAWEAEDGTSWAFESVDAGNPHAVVFQMAPLDDIDRIGKSLNGPGSPFSRGVNVEFVEVTGDERLDVVVYERGVGRTMACGTGACAVARAAWETGVVESDTVTVGLPGGDLQIRRVGDRVWMRGPAERVYWGTLSADWMFARGL